MSEENKKTSKKFTYDHSRPVQARLWNIAEDYGVNAIEAYENILIELDEIKANKVSEAERWNALGINPEDVLVILEAAQASEEPLIAHVIEDEVINELEYQRRVWRPQRDMLKPETKELNYSRFYDTSDVDERVRIGTEAARTYKDSGVRRTEEELLEYDNNSFRSWVPILELLK